MKQHFLLPYSLVGILFLFELSVIEGFSEEAISIADAVALAIAKNPSMEVFNAETRIAEARVITALSRPNPELETEVEDALGSGPFQDFDNAMYTVGIVQLIETGRKRHLRGAVADAEQEAQALRYDVARRALIRETGKRFIGVLAAQEAEENARMVLKIASDAHDAVTTQIEEGRGSAVDSGQALLGKNEAKLALERAKRETTLARKQLSATWGESDPSFTHALGNLSTPPRTIPEIQSLESSIPNHPLVLQAEAGVSAASSFLDLEEKNRIPDLTVGVGYRQYNGVDENAMVLGFSLPLPLFNKNKGGIAEAEATIARNQALVDEAKSRVQLALGESHARLVAARSEHSLIAEEMLGAATDHYSKVSEGFSLGRIKYQELLEARRSLNAVRNQKIEALARYHAARVELETLTGSDL